MDPFSAFALAGTIAQFLGILLQTAKCAYETHSSVTGASKDQTHIEELMKDLGSLSGKVKGSASIGNVGRNGPEGQLKEIAGKCETEANNLLEALRNVRGSGTHSLMSAVRQAFKTTWKAKDFERMQKRVNEYKDEMVVALLQLLRSVNLLHICDALEEGLNLA
jgi:hypothetical protein